MGRKFLCITSYESGHWLTKGKIYELDREGQIEYDDGFESYWDDKNFFHTDDLGHSIPILGSLLVELKEEQEVLPTHTPTFKKGDFVRVIGNTNSNNYKIGEIVLLTSNAIKLTYKGSYFFHTIKFSAEPNAINSSAVRMCDMEKLNVKEVKRMAKPGEIIKIVNPTTIPYTDGRPDYKKGDYLEVIKPEKRDNFAEGACRYSSSDYSKDLREKIVNSEEYVVLEFSNAAPILKKSFCIYGEEPLKVETLLKDFKSSDLIAEIKRRMER